MPSKAVTRRSTRPEESENVTVALLSVLGVAEQGSPKLMSLGKEVVPLVPEGALAAAAPGAGLVLPELAKWYAAQ
jgi:hypothetical protein